MIVIEILQVSFLNLIKIKDGKIIFHFLNSKIQEPQTDSDSGDSGTTCGSYRSCEMDGDFENESENSEVRTFIQIKSILKFAAFLVADDVGSACCP